MSNFRKDGFTPISSGHIDAAKYDSMSRTLAIKFQNGSEYHVESVSPEEHRAFMDAPSQGEHYHRFFKGNYYIVRVK